MEYKTATIKNGKLEITNSIEVDQSTMTSGCFLIQILGSAACLKCPERGKKTCGGKDEIIMVKEREEKRRKGINEQMNEISKDCIVNTEIEYSSNVETFVTKLHYTNRTENNILIHKTPNSKILSVFGSFLYEDWIVIEGKVNTNNKTPMGYFILK